MEEGTRYKRWRLFDRKADIALPDIVRYVNLVDAYRSERSFRLSNHTQYTLTAIGCAFAPDDAMTLSTVATFPYYLNNEERFQIPCGYVSVWDMLEDECEHCGILFTYAVQPSPTFSHCGNVFCAVMNGTRGQLAVAGYQLEDGYKYFESVPLTFAGGNIHGKTLFASVSTTFAVTITNMKMLNDLDMCNFSVWRVKDDLLMKHTGTKKVGAILGQSLLGHVLCDAAFAPDPTYFGMLVSSGAFVLIDIRTKTLVMTRKLGSTLECYLHCFGFDPRFPYQVIAAASAQNVYLINLNIEDAAATLLEIPPPDQTSGVTHLAYTRDGEMLGVSVGNGKALIFASTQRRYVLIHTLNPHSLSAEALSANRISFSSSGEEVSVAYSNGFVCVWQLPRRLRLKDICRLKVLCMYPMNVIESLDIPKKLKRFLKFEPIFMK